METGSLMDPWCMWQPVPTRYLQQLPLQQLPLQLPLQQLILNWWAVGQVLVVVDPKLAALGDEDTGLSAEGQAFVSQASQLAPRSLSLSALPVALVGKDSGLKKAGKAGNETQVALPCTSWYQAAGVGRVRLSRNSSKERSCNSDRTTTSSPPGYADH